MRNSYYDFNGWSRDTGVVPKKWEPEETVGAYGALPGEEIAAREELSPASKGRRRRAGAKKRLGEKSGAGGFCLILTLILVLTGVAVYFQGGMAVSGTPFDRLRSWWQEGKGENYQYDWVAELENITVPRANTGDGTVLSLTQEEGAELTAQEIYRQVSPSVVGVRAFLREGVSLGTGIVMSSDGYIITNAHIVAGAGQVSVVFSSGEGKTALLVGYDKNSDLAVLKIDGQDLPAAQFGDSSGMEVGDPVYAIGNPLGDELRGTMTDGIISAIDRVVAGSNGEMTLIQTTAALNPGNSGGALVDRYGRIVGVTNMKMMSEWETIEALGFAIPSATVKEVADQIIDRGYYAGRAMLGVTVYACRAQGDAPAGLLVQAVERKSDAWAKGLREGDIITASNGRRVLLSADLEETKAGLEAGESLTLEVWSKGTTRTVRVALVEQYSLEN